MAPTKKEKGKKHVLPSHPPPSAAPAVGQSIILNLECLDKLSPALATVFNECRRTTAWPTSHFPTDRIITEVHYFADALWAGLVPPSLISSTLSSPITRSTLCIWVLNPLPFFRSLLLFARR